MASGSVGRVRALIERFFPERQFYHRSHGEVRFISLSAKNQIGLAVVTLAFLGWVAFASVNFIFKEQIISAKERNLIALQQRYEVRLSEMQRAYDELNGLLTIAAERFSTKALELESYHDQLSSYVDHEKQLQQQLADMREQLRPSMAIKEGSSKSTVLMAAIDLEPSVLKSRRDQKRSDAELAELTNSMRLVANGRSDVHRPVARTTDRISDIEAKVDVITENNDRLLTELEERTIRNVREVEAFIQSTGLDVDNFLKRFKDQPQIGTGGPYIELDQTELVADPLEYDAHERRLFRLEHELGRLQQLEMALSRIPLALPVQDQVRMTSNFGPRRDPFTRRVAFHSGMDFGGPRGTPVYSTKAGIVVWAGPRGPYGRLVEIKHENGFRTRYAHLNRVHVKVGQRVEFGEKVGVIGSTGRSTGPHLHYEIWFDGRVQNPANFIEAGQYVFKG